MDVSKKHIGIFLIGKNGGSLFVAGRDEAIAIKFPKNVVSHLEVVDKNSFEQIITRSITEKEIKLAALYIVLDKDVTFHKELKNIPLSLQTAEVEKFTDMVPFQRLLTRTYNFSNKTIIVGANKDFCDEIVSAFAENQCPIVGFIPLVIFEEKLPHLQEHFDSRLAFKKIETIKQYFLSAGLGQQESLLTYTVPSLKNPQFIVLLSIFILVFVILGIQIWTQVLTSSSKSSSPKATVIKNNVVTSPTLSPEEASQSATISPSPRISQ